VVKSNKGTVPR
jgi:eukaryotic-like serine/threonine-protein kinase